MLYYYRSGTVNIEDYEISVYVRVRIICHAALLALLIRKTTPNINSVHPISGWIERTDIRWGRVQQRKR